jgi:hypothetical protein
MVKSRIHEEIESRLFSIRYLAAARRRMELVMPRNVPTIYWIFMGIDGIIRES